MSELVVGSIAGLAANSYVVDVSAGSTLDITNATGTVPSAVLPTGSVLQVVSTTKSDTFSTTSTSYTDITGLSATITPRSTSSKILIMFSVDALTSSGTTNSLGGIQIVRDSTAIGLGTASGSRSVATVGVSSRQTTTNIRMESSKNYLDSPATTSAVTYKLQARVEAGTMWINSQETDPDASINFRSISTITLMEIAG